jgi:hypothetical protein
LKIVINALQQAFLIGCTMEKMGQIFLALRNVLFQDNHHTHTHTHTQHTHTQHTHTHTLVVFFFNYIILMNER